MKTRDAWQAVLLAIPFLGGIGALAAAMLQDGTTPGPPLAHRYTGVNLAGGEFKGNRIPGVYGKDYVYPNKGVAAPFLAAGMNAVRLPFRWKRLQPAPMGPLDPTELARLDQAVAALKGFSLVILDPHDYASYDHAKLGTPQAPASLLPKFWRRVAQHYRGDSQVAFGLMNEPKGIDGDVWRDIAQQSVDAIRNTGATNLILVPGSNWTGAHSWTKGGNTSNAARMTSFVDPGHNMAFEMHEYPDAHSTGTGGPCVAPEAIAARLAPTTQWLRTHHARGFLAEFGAPPTPDCLAALSAMVGAMDKGDDVWLGWTYWAGGGWWGSYPYSIQPGADGEKPQMAVLKPFLAH